MIRNMGTTDRIARVVLGVLAISASFAFCFGSLIANILGVAFLVFAAVMFVTAVAGYCPTYRLFNISTEPTFHRTTKPQVKTPTYVR